MGTQSSIPRNAVISSQPPLLPSEGNSGNMQTSQDSCLFLMAISGGNLAHNTVFPTVMTPIQTLTAQRDPSTEAENIWDTNQTLLGEDFADLHIAFLKC